MNKLNLRQSRLTTVVLFCTLLLVATPFGVIQTSGADVNYWVAADNVYDEAAEFFDDSYIHEIRLYFDDPNWYDTLYEGHDDDRSTSDPYFPARFVSHGYDINPVGARFKGLSTFGFGFGGGGGGGFFNTGGSSVYDDIKKPFRIDFNLYDEEGEEETTFFGLKKLNLNNEALDPTLMREKLFMDFASKYVPTPRSVYTHVYVNDEYYGLYLAMEHMDNTYVESRFGDDEDGNIYKAESMCSLEYLGSNPTEYYSHYELKNNEEENDWSGLIELTDVLTNTPISQLPSQLEPIFDVESAMYSMALLDLFVSLDSYIGNARNYYIYQRTDTGQFTHMLWDANLAFGNFAMGMGSGTDPTEYSVFPPSAVGGFGGIIGGGGGSENTLMIVEKVMAVEEYNTAYLRALAQMLREGFDADSIAARIQQLEDLIRVAVYNDPNLQTELEEFEPEIEDTIEFVEDRAAYVNVQLNIYAEKTDLQLNELMTVNQGTITDNMGDYDPWVEIYNLGPGMVTTSNMFLTDDSGVPNKWRIPTQDIDDGEFLLLWLDGETTEGTNHASFTLDPDGGDLYMYMTSGSGYELVDSVSYPALDPDFSFGRFPDGDGLWHVLDDVVTPGEPNYYDELPEGLVINEVMANNDEAVPGPNGDYPDWIELYNGGTETVDLSGMYLTDDLSDVDEWEFPSGTVIEAGEFLVIWADNTDESGSLHASFSLNASGESVHLFAADAVTQIDSAVFGEQFDDISYGRLPDGGSSWNYLTPTCGFSNSLGEIVTDPEEYNLVEIPDGLVINEFMANNDAAVEGPNSDYPDWIEIYNGGTEAVNLTGMYLTDNMSNPSVWQFPANTVIEAGGFLVVWADNSTDSDGKLHAHFSLNADGEEIGLYAVDGETLIDSVVFSEQVADFSYGRLPDGTQTWEQLAPTPGEKNSKPTHAVVESSLWAIILLLGLAGAVSIFYVGITRLTSKRK